MIEVNKQGFILWSDRVSLHDVDVKCLKPISSSFMIVRRSSWGQDGSTSLIQWLYQSLYRFTIKPTLLWTSRNHGYTKLTDDDINNLVTQVTISLSAGAMAANTRIRYFGERPIIRVMQIL